MRRKYIKLICYFDWGSNKVMTVVTDNQLDTEGMLRFVNGFWLDDNLDLAFDDRARQRHWVPPHKIRTIEKQEAIIEEAD